MNMDINLDRRDANKIEPTHSLLGLSLVSIYLSICCSTSEPITSITYIYSERERENKRKRDIRGSEESIVVRHIANI